jgi:hypothetical protein
VLGVDVRPKDQTIVTCGVDKTVRVWKRRPLPPEDTPAAETNGNGPTLSASIATELVASMEAELAAGEQEGVQEEA